MNWKKFFHKPKNKEQLIDVLFILLLSLTPLLWFRGDLLMVGHDNVFPLDPYHFLIGRLFTWTMQGYGQSQSLIMGTIPIHFIDAIPYLLGFSVQMTQKIVYVFWFFLMGVSAYVLAAALNPQSRIFKITVSILYAFNFFILQAWWIAERTKFSAYIAFPLILAVFIKTYRQELKPFKGALYISLILFLFNGGGLFGLSLFGGLLVGIGIYILFFGFLSIYRREFARIKSIIVLLIFSILGFFLVNAYYFFPTITQVATQYSEGVVKSGGVSGFIDWASEISANASFINLFRLQGIAEWYDNPQHPYAKFYATNPILIGISFLWPVLICLPLLLVKKREKKEFVVYFFLVYLVGVFFTAGTHPPLGFLYALFIKFVPGAIAFRSPYFKFAPAIFLASSFLIAYSLDYLRNRVKQVAFILFICIVLLYHFPFFTGDFFSWKEGFSTRLLVPGYVFQFGQWLNNEKKDNGRVLTVPPNNQDFQYSVYKWGYLSFQSVPTLLSNESVVINNDRINNEERDLTFLLYSSIAKRDKELSHKLISLLGIKYFVLQEDNKIEADSPLPLESVLYKKILEEDFQAVPIRKFGLWTVYEIKDTVLPKFYTTGSINIVDLSLKELSTYYDFSDNSSSFIQQSDLQNSFVIPQNMTTLYYVPECLNCIDKDKPFIKIPERNILPDSPFYPLVLFNEELKLNKKDTKSLIYDYLGISLKRTGEIRELIRDGKQIKPQIVTSYLVLLEKIGKNFGKLSNYEDKLQVADDLNYYIVNEHSALADLLGIYVIYEDSAVILGKLLQGISSLLTVIDPYLFKLDPSNNRLYQFSVNKEENYQINLRKDDFDSALKDDASISVVIDKEIHREARLNLDESGKEKWLSFGTVHLTNGIHHLLLSYPQLPNKLEQLKQEKTEFNANVNNTCFTAKLSSFDHTKTYQIKTTYINDFTNELFFYIWEIKNNEKKLLNVFRLRNSFTGEQLAKLIKGDINTNNIYVGFCSEHLTSDLVQRKLIVNANEIIYPGFIITPEQKYQSIANPLTFKKLSPVTYSVSFTNDSGFKTLIFSERYDKGWELPGFEKNHFRANGYANGWLIDKPGKFDIVLEYKPQGVFYIGAIISGITVISIVIYLFFDSYKRRRDE